MRTATVAFLPALAGAFVLPQGSFWTEQSPLADKESSSSTLPHSDAHAWWASICLSSKDSHEKPHQGVAESLASSFESAAQTVSSLGDQLKHAVDGHHDHDFPDETIYQLISRSSYTTKFAKIVDKHPKVVDLLNNTESDYTLFVPIDEAFEHTPKDHEKPSEEFIEDLLLYHVGLGKYSARDILHTHTLPTALEEKSLGSEFQRLRTSVGFTGVRVNFYSKVVATDIGAKNGIIHGIRSILVPPPYTGRILTLFPSKFSTLLLAMEKTDFVSFIHEQKLYGSTVFAPTNTAFAFLGPRVNAFLFNTEKGLKYLKAIIKYHVASNTTLYTDAVYDETDHEEPSAHARGREHFDLATLLDDARVGVDIGTLGGFVSMRVNGFSHVTVTDGIAKNGVIQVIDRVLIPPGRHEDDGEHDNAISISVEELTERLASYVD